MSNKKGPASWAFFFGPACCRIPKVSGAGRRGRTAWTAFGGKERLFLEAIERYTLGPGSAGPRTLKEEPTARCAIERWLQEAADELTRPCHPKGCMVVMGP